MSDLIVSAILVLLPFFINSRKIFTNSILPDGIYIVSQLALIAYIAHSFHRIFAADRPEPQANEIQKTQMFPIS